MMQQLAERIEGICDGAGGTVAVAVEHLKSGQRWERLEREPFPAASLIKLPVLVAAYEAEAAGRLSFGERLRWESDDQVLGDGVLRHLTPGSLPVRDLLTLMIVVSDNVATNLVIRRLGIAAVNGACDRLGLAGTRLVRPLMVIPSGAAAERTNQVTAGDMTRLLAGLARGQVVSWDACRRMVETLKGQQIRDALPALLPPQAGPGVGGLPRWELAHKTGSIEGCEHDAGLLYLPGCALALSVLTQGLPAGEAKAVIARIGRAVYDDCSPGGESA